jgi:hypothetical protein
MYCCRPAALKVPEIGLSFFTRTGLTGAGGGVAVGVEVDPVARPAAALGPSIAAIAALTANHPDTAAIAIAATTMPKIPNLRTR